jgi:hypothetical protein
MLSTRVTKVDTLGNGISVWTDKGYSLKFDEVVSPSFPLHPVQSGTTALQTCFKVQLYEREAGAIILLYTNADWFDRSVLCLWDG